MNAKYTTPNTGRLIFIITSALLVALFLFLSQRLVQKLAVEEHNKMEIWAAATSELASSEGNGSMNLILKIVQSNTTIPVIITQANGEIKLHHNIELPKDSTKQTTTLQRELEKLQQQEHIIELELDQEHKQYLYYGSSTLLRQLSYYPYIQLSIVLLFLAIAYYALKSAKRAEQNKVWVGLSKETAHQLGTPISSLMAWMELLRLNDVDPTIVNDMDRDVQKLVTIADRFSKIGSKPTLTEESLNVILENTTNYMRSRLSGKVNIALTMPKEEFIIPMCPPLFEWVIENLCKNAVDAISGVGKIEISLYETNQQLRIEVKDNGKGIAKRNFKTIFTAGYTTKKRGWGLGLTLVKRIIEEYHHGQIYIKESEIDKGTTFCIALKKQQTAE